MKQGFTLLELLIVIAIIGLLASIVLVSYEGSTDKARTAKTLSWAGSISHLLGANAVGVWTFDNISGTTVIDDSGNGNDGVITGALQVDGVIGRALQFDNIDDGVSIANQNFTGMTKYTMGAWVKPLGSHKHYTGTVISSGNWNVAHWAFGLGQTNSSVDLRRPDGVVSFSIAHAFTVGQWHYVVIFRDGTIFDTYINSKKINSRTVGAGVLVSDASNTTIGRETYAGGYFAFNGLIDDVRIFSEALPQARIEQLYADGLETHSPLAQQ